MYWTSEHDVVLCREVVSENPFKTRKGSSQRSEIRDRIANTLNICPKLSLTLIICHRIKIEATILLTRKFEISRRI